MKLFELFSLNEKPMTINGATLKNNKGVSRKKSELITDPKKLFAKNKKKYFKKNEID